MLARSISYGSVSVRPSLTSGIVWKRLNESSSNTGQFRSCFFVIINGLYLKNSLTVMLNERHFWFSIVFVFVMCLSYCWNVCVWHALLKDYLRAYLLYISFRCSHNMVNFGPLAAELGPVVWGTTGNFNGFRVLAALLHGIPVVGVSQILRRWTEGATYIRQGGHHVGHWPTF